MLYLLKGSRIREYHQQNLAILSSDEGERVEISHGRRWIAPDVIVTRGEGGLLVFADSPYDRFVAVRFAVVDEVEVGDERTVLTVRLGPFAPAGSSARLTEAWSHHAPDDPEKPGRRFLFAADNPGVRAPRGDDEVDAAWTDICDALGDNGYFSRSTLARVRRIVDDRGVDVEPGAPVPVGQPLTVTVEARTPAAEQTEVELVPEVEPPGAALVECDAPLPASGMATFRVVPQLPGVTQVRVNLLPEPARSSRLLLRFAATEPVGPPAPPAPSVVDPGTVLLGHDDVHRLVQRLERSGVLTPELRFELYEDHLARWLPDDQVVRSAHAGAAYAIGDHGRSAELYESLERRSPDDELRFLLASLRAGRRVELTAVLDQIDLDAEAPFAQLLDVLDDVDAGVQGEVAEALAADVLGEDKLLRLLDRVLPTLRNTSLVCALADRAAYADPDRGAAFLLERWPDPTTMPTEALDLVVDWEAHANRLGPYVAEAVRRSVAAQDWPSVKGRVAKARSHVRGAERAVVLADAAQALLASGDEGRADDGFALLCEVVDEQATSGELDGAVDHARALLGAAAVRRRDDLREAAERLVDHVAAALEGSAELQAWLDKRDDEAVGRLVSLLRGRTLHLVGGQAKDWKDGLEARLALAELRLHETEKGESAAKHEWLVALSADRDVVVVLWEHLGHDVSGKAKKECKRLGVPYLLARTSERDVVAELDRHRRELLPG